MMTKQEQKRALAKARKVFKQLRPLPLRFKNEVIDLMGDIGRREILDDRCPRRRPDRVSTAPEKLRKGLGLRRRRAHPTLSPNIP